MRFTSVLVVLQLTLGYFVVETNCWFFGNRQSTYSSEGTTTVTAPKGKVPFEMTTSDEKFLAEAQFTKDLSPLDLCHHMVISKLESTCSGLAEEELAKLAVQLLNCQSEAEGRKTFTCTDDMTIKECTSNMDATIWNAYQIVSNRARAICYSSRQQQFRMKTEYTVNKLVYTTQEQLDTMDEIKKSQHDVNEATKNTLHHITESHEELMSKQTALKAAQANVHSQIVSNIRDLVREKAAIAAGNRELMDMTENIQQRLEDATKKLENQEFQSQINHDELITDLQYIREKSKEVWDKIDESSQEVLQYHDETTRNYKETIENLQKVNQTVAYILGAINNMQRGLETKLDWLTSFVGGTGDAVGVLTTVTIHILYMLMVLISAAFLQTPTFSRLLLILLVPLNAWAEVNQKKSLGFTSMTTFILLTVLCNWVAEYLWYLCTFKRREPKHIPMSAGEDSYPSSSPTRMIRSPAAALSMNIGTHFDQPEIAKLTAVLETLCKAEIFSPGDNSAILTPRKLIETITEVPCSAKSITERNGEDKTEKLNDELEFYEPLEEVGYDAEEVDTNEGETKDVSVDTMTPAEAIFSQLKDTDKGNSVKTRVEQVKRRILNSPINSQLPNKAASPARSSKTSSPASRRRSNTPNRVLCDGKTKSGMPCRLLRVDGSTYCYKHQDQ